MGLAAAFSPGHDAKQSNLLKAGLNGSKYENCVRVGGQLFLVAGEHCSLTRFTGFLNASGAKTDTTTDARSRQRDDFDKIAHCQADFI